MKEKKDFLVKFSGCDWEKGKKQTQDHKKFKEGIFFYKERKLGETQCLCLIKKILESSEYKNIIQNEN